MSDIPPNYDLLSLGIQMDIHDQLTNDCWAHAAASCVTFEIQLRLRGENRRDYKDFRVSVQHLLDHVYRDNPDKVTFYRRCPVSKRYPDGVRECGQRDMDYYEASGTLALLYMKHSGVSLEDNYEYLGDIDRNAQIPPGPRIMVDKVTSVLNIQKFGRHKIRKIIFQGHPVIAKMHLYTSFMKFKGKRVYKRNWGRYEGVHLVLIVGYGKDKYGDDYYLIQNSWGERWGDGGYAKVACKLVNEQCYMQGVSVR